LKTHPRVELARRGKRTGRLDFAALSQLSLDELRAYCARLWTPEAAVEVLAECVDKTWRGSGKGVREAVA
jgi:hypothetical protein